MLVPGFVPLIYILWIKKNRPPIGGRFRCPAWINCNKKFRIQITDPSGQGISRGLKPIPSQDTG